MSDSSYEEATRCPKCGTIGNARLKKVQGRGQVHTVYCENKLCTWYNTCWIVQVRADGTVPPPTDHRRSPKLYQGFEDHDQAARDIVASLEAQVEAEKRGDGEIRNPR
jgi:hypothetical protein